MNFPADLRYTKNHEWIKVVDDKTALVGITDFAQDQLGDIVFVEINTVGKTLNGDEIFGTVDTVKASSAKKDHLIFGTVDTVKASSDLFLPVGGTVLEVNSTLNDNPELVNSDPYGAGWLVKIEVSDAEALNTLLDASAYEQMVG